MTQERIEEGRAAEIYDWQHCSRVSIQRLAQIAEPTVTELHNFLLAERTYATTLEAERDELREALLETWDLLPSHAAFSFRTARLVEEARATYHTKGEER